MQRGLYQRFVKMHIDDMSSKEAHGAMTNDGNEWSGSCVFMFWHRKYLLAFENMLRSLGDLYKCVTVPYLDYATDYNKQLTGSNCASGSRNFLACSAAAQELGGVSGTFRSTKPIFGYTYADLTCVRQSPLNAFCSDAGTFNDRTKCDRCVPRTDWSRISIPNDVSYTSLRTKILSRSISSSPVLSFQNWSSAVEYEPHNMIHATLSGPMSNALIAPTDPIFFLHHATMDLLQTIYFHCRIEPKGLTDDQLQNDPMVFQGCMSRNNHYLGVNSTVFMRESGSNLRADEHPATASYFRNIPTAYFRLTDTTRLGPGLSYKYKIEGPLGQVYQECDNAPKAVVAAASVLNAMESMTATATAKQPSSKHEVLQIFRAANVKMQDLEAAVLAAAQRQGLTLEEGQAELQKMIVVAHQACVPGGVKDVSAPLQASGSRFAVAPSPSYQLWKSIEAHETPMRIFQWAILLKEFLGCDAQAVLKLPA
jgi:tyrosinase